MTHMDAPVVVSVIAAKSDAPEEEKACKKRVT